MMMINNDARNIMYIYYILANESLASILLRAGLARGSAPPSTLPMALALPSPTPAYTTDDARFDEVYGRLGMLPGGVDWGVCITMSDGDCSV